jgi:hypothetical protein
MRARLEANLHQYTPQEEEGFMDATLSRIPKSSPQPNPMPAQLQEWGGVEGRGLDFEIEFSLELQ